MKNRFLGLIMMATCACSMAMAQTVEDNELAMVYYMPQTQLAVTIDYTIETVEPGPFYLYAERYLGVKEVATKAYTRYEVTGLSLSTKTVADTHRAYKVVANNGSEAQWLSLTADGMLYGYNVPAPAQLPQEAEKSISLPAAIEKPLMPLMEEQMVASSVAKMAEGAAKQIYHIREMRMNLLAGDVEHTPADGQAMLLVLNELDKREQMLAALFIGSRKVEKQSHTIHYVPSKDVTERIIGRVSQYAGIVPADDLSGEPIRLTMAGKRQEYASTNTQSAKSSKAAIPSQLYYNLPGTAKVVVEFGKDMRVSATLPIAQFGVAVPIAKSLLLSQPTPKIHFNTQTGNILSIEQ